MSTPESPLPFLREFILLAEKIIEHEVSVPIDKDNVYSHSFLRGMVTCAKESLAANQNTHAALVEALKQILLCDHSGDCFCRRGAREALRQAEEGK